MFKLVKNGLSLLPYKNFGVWLLILSLDGLAMILSQGGSLGYAFATYIGAAMLILQIADSEVKYKFENTLFSMPLAKSSVIKAKLRLVITICGLVAFKTAIIGLVVCLFSPIELKREIIINTDLNKLAVGLLSGMTVSTNLFFCYFLLFYRYRFFQNSNNSSLFIMIFTGMIPVMTGFIQEENIIISLFAAIIVTAIIFLFSLRLGKLILEKRVVE